MSLKKLLNKVRKSTGSESFKTSQFGEIKGYINTGDYGLNRIITGDVNLGIPEGRVVLLAGESQTGKSLIAAKIVVNALKENNYDHVFYFDSEGGSLKSFFEAEGCDTDKIEHIILDSCEDATVKILGVYKAIVAEKEENPDLKFLCVTDSVGALVPNKLLTDAEKGKQAQDMGLRAKLINNLVKGIMIPVLRSNTTMILLNHVYDDPASLFPSKIKNQSGGKQLQFIPHISIQCTKKFEKAESKDEEFYGGNILKFITIKNRIVRPFIETEVHVDFSTGFSKWNGIVEPAKNYGFLVQEGSYYKVPTFDDKKRYLKEILKRDEIWESFIDEFNKKSKEDLKYSSQEQKDFEEVVRENEEEEITE